MLIDSLSVIGTSHHCPKSLSSANPLYIDCNWCWISADPKAWSRKNWADNGKSLSWQFICSDAEFSTSNPIAMWVWKNIIVDQLPRHGMYRVKDYFQFCKCSNVLTNNTFWQTHLYLTQQCLYREKSYVTEYIRNVGEQLDIKQRGRWGRWGSRRNYRYCFYTNFLILMEEGGDSRPMRIGRGQKMDGWMEKVDESKQRQKSSGLLYVGDEAG